MLKIALYDDEQRSRESINAIFNPFYGNTSLYQYCFFVILSLMKNLS